MTREIEPTALVFKVKDDHRLIGQDQLTSSTGLFEIHRLFAIQMQFSFTSRFTWRNIRDNGAWLAFKRGLEPRWEQALFVVGSI